MTQKTENVVPACEEETATERLEYKVDALEHELNSALDVLIRRINGEADLRSAAEWVVLNYPRKGEGILPDRRPDREELLGRKPRRRK
jgi:hypothetical protein